MAAPKYLENYVYRLIPDTEAASMRRLSAEVEAALAEAADTGRFSLLTLCTKLKHGAGTFTILKSVRLTVEICNGQHFSRVK